MSIYLGQVKWLWRINELMLATPNIEKQLEQCQKMFLAVTLVGLPFDLDLLRDQIFANFIVPIVD